MTTTGIIRTCAVICANLALVACSSPLDPDPAPPAPVSAPSSSIQASINQVVSGIVGAVNGTRPRSGGGGSAGLNGLTLLPSPRTATTCNVNTGVCQVNESYEQRVPCSGGGSLSILAQLTGSINSNGGNLSWRSYSTFANCSANGWVTNSNPYLTGGGTIGIFGSRMTLNLTLGGGFNITNAPGTPAGRSDCNFSGVLLQWDSLSQRWSNSGSVICTPGGTFRF